LIDSEPGRSPSNKKATYVLAGGSMLALVGLLADLQAIIPARKTPEGCQGVIQPQAVLSRDQLTALLNTTLQTPTTTPKQTIRAIAREPYCILPSLTLPPNEPVEREAYPLAFDPDTWIVLRYTGDAYAGFEFSFRQ